MGKMCSPDVPGGGGGLPTREGAPMDEPVVARRGVEVGLLKLSVTAPWPGRDRDYFEWYDRDHAYSANLAGPGVFAGRLWYSSAACGDLGFAAPDSPLSGRGGRFLATYLVLDGDVAAWSDWSTQRYTELGREGRSFSARTTALAQLFEPTWTVTRDNPGVPLHCALDHPFRGVAMVITEHGDDGAAQGPRVEGPSRPTLRRGSPVALAAGFSPRSIHGWASPAGLPAPDAHALELWFSDQVPSVAWTEARRQHDEELRRSGSGRIVWFAAFEPTVPGGALG